MTATARNAQTAALEALIEAHAIELMLPTVRRRYRALAHEASREQQTPVAYLAALLEAQMAERAERREKPRLIDARFPQIKRLEDFRFADNPTVPKATIAALAEGSWIDDREARRRRRARLPGPLRTPRTRRPDRHDDPAVRRMDEGVPDPRLAKAVVDRLTHRAYIIDTGNESWRFRHGLRKKGARPSAE